MPDHIDPEACPSCDCPMDDHRFGQSYIDYAASLINDYPQMYDYEDRMPNPCMDCCACPRDPMEAA